MLLITTSVPLAIAQTTNQIHQRSDWNQQQKILASDGEENDWFSFSVSVSGTTALIGAPNDNDMGDYAGSAYVYTLMGSTWMEQEKLLAYDGEEMNTFGDAVCLDGDTAIVGAPYDWDNGVDSGSAYVFFRSGESWTMEAKLLASDGAGEDHFSLAVAVSGDTVLIGAPGDDDNGTDSGSAYVFNRIGNTWTQQAKLDAQDASAGDNFGKALALSGDTALIGAYYDDNNGVDAGSAYVFTRTGDTWTQQAKLLAADGTENDNFGDSVSLDGATALVGATRDNSFTGAAYVFVRTEETWTQQAKLLATDAQTYKYFGQSVALDSDTALIGAPDDSETAFRSGAAYVFERTGNTWTQQAKLLASDGEEYDLFGNDVALSGNIGMIGTPWESENGFWAGCAYVFTKKVENQRPNPPTIDGPTSGKIKTAHTYNISADDPNADDVSYYVDWGDGTNTGWLGSVHSGDTVPVSHTWTKKDTYLVKAKAKDYYGLESNWTTLEVSMPMDISVQLSWGFPFLTWLFDQFPDAFSRVRNIMGC